MLDPSIPLIEIGPGVFHPAPGVYDNISIRDYHELPSVSNSYLGRLEPPAKAKLPFEETPTLLFGRACHSFILEGKEAFDKEFAVSPKYDRRTKEGKMLSAQFEAAAFGKSVINEEDYQIIGEMANAVLSHPTAQDLLVKGMSEQTVIWIDEETGIICRCRPDFETTTVEGVLADFKTTADASEHAFKRSVVAYGYDRQASMYKEGVFMATKKQYDIFTFIVGEKEPPYRVEVYTLDINFMQHGFDEFHRLLRIEKECRKNNFWPHYQNAGATELIAPMYLQKGAYE